MSAQQSRGDACKHYLKPLFEPRSVAIVGATETPGKIGEGIVSNMRAARFGGKLFAVNPKYRTVRGMTCYPDMMALPEAPDLAVIATPPQTVPRLISDCGSAGVRNAVVITAGFSEVGPSGAALEQEVLSAARQHGLRLLGPNCLGILRPSIGLNASFSRGAALVGDVALLSQSGAVCTAMLDRAAATGLGFSSVISLGGSVDVGFAEALDYLAADPATRHILMYVEGVRDARRFLGSLRAAAFEKNVVLMKVGRRPDGSRAAVSHTGAIVGADDVFDAAIARTAALRVQTIEQLTMMGEVLAGHGPEFASKGRGRIAIITNGGGPGVMAADRAGDLSVPLAMLSGLTISSLKTALPANWSHGNPLDLIGDADPARYRAAVAACLADDGVDGVLVILTPQSLTDPTSIAEAVVAAAKRTDKPLLACWMGGQSVVPGCALLRNAGIGVFDSPEAAMQAWADLSALPRLRTAQWLSSKPLVPGPVPNIAAARAVVDAALKARSGEKVLLGVREAKALLTAFHIPVVEHRAATGVEEAVAAATEVGFPVAMKVRATGITHKSDVGGVRLDLADAAAVREAYVDMLSRVAQARPDAVVDGVSIEPMLKGGRELLVGVMCDRVFGPAITFGAGGIEVEVLRDRSVALPPLDAGLVANMVASTRVSKLLLRFRGAPPANYDAIEAVLLRVSEMVCLLPELVELDINPLIVDEKRAIGLDARVVLASAKTALPEGPGGHLAVPLWPAHFRETVRLENGASMELRPIRPEDTGIECAFINGLSERSRRFRFMTSSGLAPKLLARFTHPDYDREMALIAVHNDVSPETETGVARYCSLPDGASCEFAVAVADAWQGKGLGMRLMQKLIIAARSKGLTWMRGEVLADNLPMLGLCRALGFQVIPDGSGDMRTVILNLHAGSQSYGEAPPASTSLWARA